MLLSLHHYCSRGGTPINCFVLVTDSQVSTVVLGPSCPYRSCGSVPFPMCPKQESGCAGMCVHTLVPGSCSMGFAWPQNRPCYWCDECQWIVPASVPVQLLCIHGDFIQSSQQPCRADTVIPISKMRRMRSIWAGPDSQFLSSKSTLWLQSCAPSRTQGPLSPGVRTQS